jgi:dihydroneopterin aldolase/2-amino-4-hydroxy-6-hydroxymethyldihydropteridine diphosphokinase
MRDTVYVEGLELYCVIGVFGWERETKQKVRIDLEIATDISRASATENLEMTVDYKRISKAVIGLVEPSSFQLVETMAERVADLCLEFAGVERVKVKVSKPGAVRYAVNVAVEITRPRKATSIYLGVGGNIEPEKHLGQALALLRERFSVGAVSSVYRSAAWGVSQPQPDYLNLAVAAATDKDLFAVRAEIRWIEELLGRKRQTDTFAPRTVDIDLLLYGDRIAADAGGRLPHPQLLTQPFVYLPMTDIAPGLTVPGREGSRLSDIPPAYADPTLACEKTDITFEK